MLSEQWTKSRRSGNNGNCVEVRLLHGRVEVRDSKDPNGATLTFTLAEWAAFTGGVVDGEFDLPA